MFPFVVLDHDQRLGFKKRERTEFELYLLDEKKEISRGRAGSKLWKRLNLYFQ